VILGAGLHKEKQGKNNEVFIKSLHVSARNIALERFTTMICCLGVKTQTLKEKW
jgi:hypothetical protein